MDIANSIKFFDICHMMEKVKSAKTMQRKEIVLMRYYNSFSKHRQSFRDKAGVAFNHPEDGNSSFFSVLRLLIPSADKERNNYGLQITALGRLYTRVLQLEKESDDAKRLTYQSLSASGDYAEVIHSVLLPRCHNEPSNLALKQVHDILDMIANGDTSVKIREVIRFAELASAEEQKWLIRILLKSMALGIGEKRIFNLMHPSAYNMYMRCTDLKRICNFLADEATATMNSSIKDNVVDLNAFVEPFRQIRPMLCERFPGKIEELMQSDVLYLETKMDGERFQLHYARGKFKYISRNGIDYTKSFGESFEQGTLTPQLRSVLPLDLDSIILDGEMMIWDTQNRRYREKSENTDVKHLKSDDSWRPCFVVYDLLYLNGKSILNMTYVQRIYKLHEFLNEQQGVLQIMRGVKINSMDHFNLLFQQMLDSNAEGIVLKKQNSTYLPGVRAGGGWYKDKPDYINGLITEFDVLIIGGFYNRNRTFIESFLLGVLKHGVEYGHGRDEVFSIGCVANNTQQRSILHHKLSPFWRIVKTEPPPVWYHFKANVKEGCPDVWIQPQDSIILQVKAASLTPNGAFFTAKSLHFPRTQIMRDDKDWNECMTLHEYSQLCQHPGAIQTLNKRNLDIYDCATKRKRRKLTPVKLNCIELDIYEQHYNSKSLENLSQLLNGFSFCILSGMRGYTKKQLQKLAIQNGGSIALNPIPNDPKCICLCGYRVYLVDRLIEQQPRTNDILCMDWLIRVCKYQQLQLRPKDVLSASEELKKQLTKNFDKFNDSFTDVLSSPQELHELLQNINQAELDSEQVKRSDLQNLELQLLGDKTINTFSNNFGYFYNQTETELARLLFKQHGGQLVSEFGNMDQTHLFVCPAQQNFKQNPKYAVSETIKIVSTDSIWQSHQTRCNLSKAEFIL